LQLIVEGERFGISVKQSFETGMEIIYSTLDALSALLHALLINFINP
jgi:hypothetical protein